MSTKVLASQDIDLLHARERACAYPLFSRDLSPVHMRGPPPRFSSRVHRFLESWLTQSEMGGSSGTNSAGAIPIKLGGEEKKSRWGQKMWSPRPIDLVRMSTPATVIFEMVQPSTINGEKKARIRTSRTASVKVSWRYIVVQQLTQDITPAALLQYLLDCDSSGAVARVRIS